MFDTPAVQPDRGKRVFWGLMVRFHMDQENQRVRRHWLVALLQPKIAIPALVLLMLLSVPIVFRGCRLVGVPTIGEPFDVEDFVSYTVPEDQHVLSRMIRTDVSAGPRMG